MMPTDAERLAAIETKQDGMNKKLDWIVSKLQNGLTSDVAILMEDRKSSKWLLRTIIGAIIVLVLAQVFTYII